MLRNRRSKTTACRSRAVRRCGIWFAAFRNSAAARGIPWRRLWEPRLTNSLRVDVWWCTEDGPSFRLGLDDRVVASQGNGDAHAQAAPEWRVEQFDGGTMPLRGALHDGQAQTVAFAAAARLAVEAREHRGAAFRR